MSKWSSAFRDSRWQRKRLEVMERDGWRCTSCGKSAGVILNVHHIHYEAGLAPWEYSLSSLVTWCETCHETRHELQKNALLAISQFPFDLFLSVMSACAYMPLDVAKMYDESIREMITAEVSQ